ncbi:uncharacterized protein LOC119871826 isoform X2 [Canis lupus familiaris]|uniref:uncharacterized protein LOC119871826 isoform X2 n=1 Tax=Canis lupus familiaris TaxID=9615 RepID=UPI0018F5E6A5|nr:uncharacterized protein LOC119871826 isoform X2 [Canis lupus familiaris]XP_038521006.1 uncharacterized protein LOC119871826 isoform X2 [Canis lupus familiaris]
MCLTKTGHHLQVHRSWSWKSWKEGEVVDVIITWIKLDHLHNLKVFGVRRAERTINSTTIKAYDSPQGSSEPLHSPAASGRVCQVARHCGKSSCFPYDICDIRYPRLDSHE